MQGQEEALCHFPYGRQKPNHSHNRSIRKIDTKGRPPCRDFDIRIFSNPHYPPAYPIGGLWGHMWVPSS